MSLVVGLLMWPRGVVVQLQRAVAAAYGGAADYLREALADAAGRDPADLARARRRGDEDVEVARDVFELANAQRGGSLPHAMTWGRLISGSAHVLAVADLIANLAARGWLVEGQQESALIARSADDAACAFGDVAAAVGAPSEAAGGTDHAQVLLNDADELAALSTARLRAGDRDLPVLVSVWVSDWLRHLAWVDDRSRERSRLLGRRPDRSSGGEVELDPAGVLAGRPTGGG